MADDESNSCEQRIIEEDWMDEELGRGHCLSMNRVRLSCPLGRGLYCLVTRLWVKL